MVVKLRIVPIFAAYLAIVYFFLTVHVGMHRYKSNNSLGNSKGDPILEAKIRRHGNFSEYVPIALILLTMLELNEHPDVLIYFLCTTLVVGRTLHIYGLQEGPPKPSIRMLCRFIGMVSTVLSILIASISLLYDACH